MSDAYEAWRRQVDHLLATVWQVQVEDLPALPWRQWWDDGIPADEVPGEVALLGLLPRCVSCNGPLPAEPVDTAPCRKHAGAVCSTTCHNREHRRRHAARHDPDHVESACERKDAFPTRERAEQSIARHARQQTHQAYECRHCGAWHIGGYGPRPEDTP